MWVLHKGLHRDVDNGGTGGAGSASGGAGSGAAGVSDTPAPNGTAPAAFDWKGLNLDPGLQNVVDAHQWKSPADLLGSYTNLQKVMGIKGSNPERIVVLPKDGDAPEAWNEVFAKLGRPEKPEDYGLPVPDGQPKEFAGKASQWFHELGIPKGAAVKLAERWNAHITETMTAQQAQQTEQHTAQLTQLKTEWGADYDANAATVDKAAQTFGMSQDQLSALKQVMGPGGAMKFLHSIGSRLGAEGRFVAGDGGSTDVGMTVEQARAEIMALKQDRSFIEQWNSPKDPKARQEARAKMERLQKIAYPGATEIRAAK